MTAPVSVPPPTEALDGAWTAQVLTLGSTDGGKQRAVLLVSARAGGVSGPRGPWRVYAWLPRYPALIPTDRIAFDGTVEPVRQDGSEFAAYLTASHVAATSRISALRLVEAPADPFGIAERLRGAADSALARVLPEPMAGLASGILVGRRDRVSREVTDSFTTTGLSHVVAISGWNICLVGAVIGGLLSAAGLSRRSRSVAIVVALGCFTLLAGTGASVVRAAFMGGVALIARETGRPGSAVAALGLAVWMLLLLDPSMVTDVGFQLSVTATAGLLWWGSRLTRRLAGAAPNRPRRWLAESLGVSLAAQAATLPLVLLHFGRLSLVSPIANLIIAPLVAPAMLVGSVALVAGLAVGAGLPFMVGAPFALLGWLVLGAMVAVSGVLAQVPMASLALPPAIGMLVAIGTALAVGAVAWRACAHDASVDARRPRAPNARRWTVIITHRRSLAVGLLVVSVLASLGVVTVTRAGPGRLTVTVLDVGQGDAILVDGPRGGRILLDSGPDPDRLLTVLDRHVPAWDRRLDLVVLTHPHEDHVAGLAVLVERYRVAVIAENGMLGSGPGDAAFRSWLAATHVLTRRLAAGDRLELDDIGMNVLWPIRGTVPVRSPSIGRAVNDTSIVLDVRYGERRMLLTGDIEDDVDPTLLGHGIGGPAGRRLDVLKVAHHGSRTATSEAWLNALQPRMAMISAGTGNPYGHPAPETVARLRAHGARVLRTDLDGDLQVSTDGHDLRWATSGGRPIGDTTPVATAQIASVASVPSVFVSGYLCAIPLSSARLATLPPPPARHPPRGRPPMPAPQPRGPTRLSDVAVGIWSRACYDRVDHGTFPRGRGRPPAVALALHLAATTRLGRRRRRLLPRRRRDPRGPPGGPARRGSGRLAARPGQGAAGQRSASDAGSRARRRPLARGAWLCGAGTSGREPPCGSAHRSALRGLGPVDNARAAHRGLRGQACPATDRDA
jgi:competence protein ComEC